MAETKTLSRRDFLKLGVAGTFWAVASQAVPYFVRSDPSGDIPDGKLSETSPIVEGVGRGQIIKSTEKLAAIGQILYTQADVSNWWEYLLTRYQINSDSFIHLANIKQGGMGINDLLTFFKSCPIEYAPDGNVLLNYYQNPHSNDNLSVISDYYSKQVYNSSEWLEAIEKNNLYQRIVREGDRGVMLLSNLGVDISGIDFQSKLLPEADAIQIDNVPSLNVISHQNPIDTIVSIVVGDDEQTQGVFKFYPEIDQVSSKKAEFVMARLSTIADTCESVSGSIPVGEFEVLQSMVYEHFLLYSEGNAQNTENDFFDNKLFESGGVAGNPLNKVPEKIQFLQSKLIESGVSENQAKSIIISAAKGSVGAFKQIIDKITPGARSVFNTKSSRTSDGRTLQEILRFAHGDSNKLTKSGLLKSTYVYAGNLYLMPIVDRTILDGRKNVLKKEKDSKSLNILTSQLINNSITLEEFASEVLGYRTIAVYTPEGAYKGKVLNGIAIEPVVNPRQDLVDFINSVEGPMWKSGKDYLKKFIGGNLLAAMSARIQSGGSDPAMQLIKLLAPSIYDNVIYDNLQLVKDKAGSTFHRPDLYSASYLAQLYYAVRDEQPAPYFYEKCGNFDAEKLKGSNIGQICAQLEKFLIARDFKVKFGDQKIIDLYAQYVPFASNENGLQICGFEAAANYYFDKHLNRLNQGELAILVGMIQAPFTYAPNTPEVVKRATLASSLIAKKSGYNKNEIDIQIKNAHFVLKSPDRWLSDETSLFTEGTFTQNPINLGFGLAVVNEPHKNQIYSDVPILADYDIPIGETQVKYDMWLNEAIDKDQVKLETHENSEIAKTINDFWNVVVSGQSNGYEGSQIAVQVENWCKKNSINYKEDPALKYHLEALRNTNNESTYWQCGQAVLLINDIARLKFNLDTPPFLAVQGDVKNWVRYLNNEKYTVQGGYEFIRIDDILSTTKIDLQSTFRVGDVVVSWNTLSDASPGHVCIIADMGISSNGETYVRLLDNNFHTNNKARDIVVWSRNISQNLSPEHRSHSIIIRPTKKLDHGSQAKFIDDLYGKKVLTATIDGRRVTLPAITQERLTSKNTYDQVVNVGAAVSVFDEGGFVAGMDNTNLLEGGLVQPGNAIKLFVYAFFRSQGYDPKNKTFFYPDNYSLNGSDDMVTNSSQLIMNLDTERQVTLDQALAGGFDVPFQMIMKDMLNKNVNAWDDLQEFLGIFGVELLDNRGKKMLKPGSLSAVGRGGVYVRNLDVLGFGLSILANPEKYFDVIKDANLIDILRGTVNVITSDEIRNSINVRGDNLGKYVSDYKFDPNNASSTTSVRDRGQTVLWSGSRLGDEDLGLVISPKRNGQGNKVVVSRFKGGIAKTNKSVNLISLGDKALGVGEVGFPALTITASVIDF